MIRRLLVPFGIMMFASVASAHSVPTGPEQAVRETVETLQSLIQKNQAEYQKDHAAFYKAVNQVAVPRFDVPYIAQIVLARYWRTASPQQREAFESAFKDMLIRSYANTLLANAGSTKIVWKPARLSDDDATVRTELERGNGKNYPVNFSVHKVNGDWKIYDITIDNLSLALNFRSQIDSSVQREGLNRVIDQLEHRTQQP